jgi:hypothetical protein
MAGTVVPPREPLPNSVPRYGRQTALSLTAAAQWLDLRPFRIANASEPIAASASWGRLARGAPLSFWSVPEQRPSRPCGFDFLQAVCA